MFVISLLFVFFTILIKKIKTLFSNSSFLYMAPPVLHADIESVVAPIKVTIIDYINRPASDILTHQYTTEYYQRLETILTAELPRDNSTPEVNKAIGIRISSTLFHCFQNALKIYRLLELINTNPNHLEIFRNLREYFPIKNSKFIFFYSGRCIQDFIMTREKFPHLDPLPFIKTG